MPDWPRAGGCLQGLVEMPKKFVLSSFASAAWRRTTLASVLSLLCCSTAMAQTAVTTTVDVGGFTGPASIGTGFGASAASALANSALSGAQTSGSALQNTSSQQSTAEARADLEAGASESGETSESEGGDQTQLTEATLESSQFQNFVRQTTGKQLPVYGRALFANPKAYMADSVAPVPDGHLIAPGDQIKLQTWGGFDYSDLLTVDRNGQVSIPSVGAVNVAGVRAADVGKVLGQQIGKIYSNFEINATMGRLRGIPVYVVGQAQRPGTHTVSSASTLINALFASGGPSALGSMRNIQLKRNGQVIAQLDLYDFISKGDKRNDVALKAGDTIVIAPVGPRVAITGAFDHEAIYELKGQGSSLGEILALNGGPSVLVNTQKVQIERIDPDANGQRKVESLALDAKGMQHVLKDGDIVTLLGISPAFANAVTLQGNVAAPLRYRWFEGMRISDLIPEPNALITPDYYLRKNHLVQNVVVDEHLAGKGISGRVRNMVDQVNWDYAVVERLDKKHLRTVLIPFNLGRAVLYGDEAENILLQAGDIVTVLSEKDLKLPEERQTRLVRVEGEVAAPGIYQLLPGETLNQLLTRIGGVTPQAYLYGMQVRREAVRQSQQENLDLLIRRLESQQQSQMLYLLANRSSSDMGSQAAIMEQQQKMAQTQIAALRKLRSNGRIALELDPKNAVLTNLPDLPLEDKDHIFVPRTPAFVSVAGAVNNENVFIYKPGRTVGEVIKVAGLREEADKKQMFVLRADGSIATGKNGGWFGSVAGVELMPGDTIIVPEKLDRESTRSFVMRQFKDVTQILSQFGLGVAAIKVIKDL